MVCAEPRGWQFWVDRGGTFTDVVACDPQGVIASLKLLSVDPRRYEDAAVEGIRRFLAAAPEGERRVAAVRMGTTVATNALLERRGEQTVLVVTAGLEDALRIGTQQRPDIFALDIRLPEMLYAKVIGAKERVSAHGDVIVPMDEARLEADLGAARAAGIDSVAIALLHGYRFPEHERRAGEIARGLGFSQISLSHETSPLMKLIPRGHTTLVDAYLSPILRRYVGSVREGLEDLLGERPLLFMQSHGGLVRAERFRGKDSILSGPAGGVIGMVETARAAGFERVLGFDMGGTSTDVSLYAGELERTTAETIAGVHVTAPMLRIHTVAAGGGSIVKFESSRLQVGPASAGALPGPACYRNGGPSTVTDANVLLGRIQPDFFPHTFGPDGCQPIDTDIVRARFDALAADITAATGVATDAERVAAGAIEIAVERMANAVKRISIARGHDVTDFALVSFGGAGGQHACRVADALGIDTIFMHALAGVLSAYGMGLADLRTIRRCAIEQPLATAEQELVESFERLADEARNELLAQDVASDAIVLEGRLGLKTQGADTTLPIAWQPSTPLSESIEAFGDAHSRYFGFRAPQRAVVVEWLEVEGIGTTRAAEERALPDTAARPEAVAHRRIWFDDSWRQTPVYRRVALASSAIVHGPALIVEAHATTVVESAWQAAIGDFGHVVLTRTAPRAAEHAARLPPGGAGQAARAPQRAHGRPSPDERRRDGVRDGDVSDPVLLEVFNNLFMHIAEQMGVVLEHSAHSVNIKERLDFSCAVFDPAGDLIANAPHIPVHLGSMGDSVRSVLNDFRHDMSPGDVFMLNAPYNGGTHLPDITVVTPVFESGEGRVGTRRLAFVVASRAHHADIGGTTPGSMPPLSTTIDEEGVVIDGMRIVAQGCFLERECLAVLTGGRYPARNPAQNIADLEAQIAANARGADALGHVVERYGLEVVHAYMAHVKANAEECVREAIEGLADGASSASFDSGEEVVVTVRVDRAKREAVIDFTGTSAASRNNLNAPSAVARAAVLYVFRTLVQRNIPLNAGCLRPLTVTLPEGSLVCPRHPAAVVAGNVETSQCIVDALLAALGACAASQGTMNNLTFGDERYQYYETLCGGAGAGPGFDGASAVHTHMTNSRLTDPEVLEWRYPVRIRRFEIRRGSGGAGRHRGGDGVVRDLEFLEPMQAAILSNRRRVPPFGLAGGGDGKPGRNYLVRASGVVEELPATAAVALERGDRFVIETPGGGGYGRPPPA